MSLLTQSTVAYQPRWSFAWWHDTVCCHLMCWNHESVTCWALFISCFADQHIKCFITTHTLPFNGPFPGLPRWAGTRKVKPIWIYWSKRQWVAVASAGPHASQYLAPDNHASTPPQSFLQAGCRSRRPTDSVKALKAQMFYHQCINYPLETW